MSSRGFCGLAIDALGLGVGETRVVLAGFSLILGATASLDGVTLGVVALREGAAGRGVATATGAALAWGAAASVLGTARGS